MPAVSQVIRGAVNILTGDGTTINVTISSVDTSRAIVMFTERNADYENRLARHYFSAYLSSATNLQFLRNASSFAKAVDIQYTVVEFSSGAVTLQTGSRASAADPDDIAITAVDTAAAFPILTFQTDLLGVGSNDWAPRPLFVTTTDPGDTLRLDFAATPGANDFTSRWQVVEFASADVTVQSGTIAMSSAYSGTATITSVDTAKTLVAGFGMGAGYVATGYARIYLASATQVAASQMQSGTAPTWHATWYAIEMLDGSTVEAGTATIANTATVPATAPSWAAAMTDGAVFSASHLPNGYVDSASTYPQDAFFSVSLDTPQDGVTIARVGSASVLTLAWQVVEWAAGTVQIGVPISTITAGAWTAVGAATLHEAMGSPRNDAIYAKTLSPSTMEVGVTVLTNPVTGDKFVRYTLEGTGTENCDVSLIEDGTTTVQTWNHTNIGALTLYEPTVTGTLTNAGAMSLRFAGS